MKKIISVFIFSLYFSVLFAKPSSAPEWLQNYRNVYPNSQYLVQRGSGDSAEKAKTDATVALSRYFQTNVNANLSTTMTSVTTNNSIDEKTVVVDDVNVQSQVEFFGLEYTEPYYLKSEKKWYCVVYLNREAAWQQYKPQIDIKKNSFNGLYKNLEKETDSFKKLSLCKKVWNSGKELMEKLEYGRIINPNEEAAYQSERDVFAEIPVIFEDAKQNCSIYIRINRDYNQSVSTAVSTELTDCGFNVVKNQAESNYTAEISVDENITGNEPLSIKPSIDLKIVSKDGKTVYSLQQVAGEKSIGYSLESAQKKSYPKLSKELQEAIKQNLSGLSNL